MQLYDAMLEEELSDTEIELIPDRRYKAILEIWRGALKPWDAATKACVKALPFSGRERELQAMTGVQLDVDGSVVDVKIEWSEKNGLGEIVEVEQIDFQDKKEGGEG